MTPMASTPHRIGLHSSMHEPYRAIQNHNYVNSLFNTGCFLMNDVMIRGILELIGKIGTTPQWRWHHKKKMCGTVCIPVNTFFTGYTKANQFCRLWGVHKPGKISHMHAVYISMSIQIFPIKMQFALYRVFEEKMEFHQVSHTYII